MFSLFEDINIPPFLKASRGFFKKSAVEKAEQQIKQIQTQKRRKESKLKLLEQKQKEGEKELVDLDKQSRDLEELLRKKK